MNGFQASKEIDRIADLPHKQPATTINAVKEGIKAMLYTSDFYEDDIVAVFSRFCETGMLDFTGVKKVEQVLNS